MPRKSDKIAINNKELDRRIKLSEKQKEQIIEKSAYISIRQLSKMYNVSRRTIDFTINPKKLKENIDRRKERGVSYYDRKKNTDAQREHRQYKKELYEQNLIQLTK